MPYDDPVSEFIDHVAKIELCRSINFKSPCYIIAEIGQNHQGDIMMAKKLIKLAKVRTDDFKHIFSHDVLRLCTFYLSNTIVNHNALISH
jgi:sialic acid synthase SpsE